MKDKLGTEINEGDYVVQVNYPQWTMVGIVSGGITAGGKIRYKSFSQCSRKETSYSKNLIIITREQVKAYIENQLQLARINFEQDPNHIWAEPRLRNWEQTLHEFLSE